MKMNLLKRFPNQNMKNKKGQFYLLAAIIIITVIVGIATISNFAQKKSDIKLYDIKEELLIESAEVLEYGQFSVENINEILKGFIEEYQEYAGENKNLSFVFGNFTSVSLVRYEQVITGNIQLLEKNSMNIKTSQTTNQTDQLNVIEEEGTKKVIATINNIDYLFDLKPGHNFFFVISQEVEGEQHIIKS